MCIVSGRVEMSREDDVLVRKRIGVDCKIVRLYY